MKCPKCMKQMIVIEKTDYYIYMECLKCKRFKFKRKVEKK